MTTIFGIELFALMGFLFGSYAIVANDAIQTLGTFLSSNAQRNWRIMWLYASSIIVTVIVYGYITNGGDIAYSRLNKIPYPDQGMQWWHVLPPMILLFLTRYGIPVSTTFMVLTVFTLTGGSATEGVMAKMLVKSALGYAVAFLAGGLIYVLVARKLELWISKTRDLEPKTHWTVIQWCSTAFLWSQWLIQDLANIFVFLPRTTSLDADGVTQVSFSLPILALAVVIMVALHALIFSRRGGEIQKIVTRKVNTVDVRAATLIDLIFAFILLLFKEVSDIPMSTTWVFLGLLAGREIAISWIAGLRDRKEAINDVLRDVGRALLGLVISIILAIGVPALATGVWPPVF